MAIILALHKTPTDVEAFDAHFHDTHVPLAKSIPGIRSVEISDGLVMIPDGAAPYHRVGVLRFDSLADLQAGMGSPEGMAAAADLANFSTGGFTILIFDSRVV